MMRSPFSLPLFDSLGLGLAHLDRAGLIHNPNLSLATLLGQTWESLESESFSSWLEPGGGGELLGLAERCRKLRTPQSRIFTLRRQDQSRFWATVSLVPLSPGADPEMLHLVVQEVTELLQLRQGLEESERRFRHLAENTSDGLLQTDAAGRIVYASPSYRKRYGEGPQETVPQDVEDIRARIHPEDVVWLFPLIAQAIAEGRETLIYEFRFLEFDGRVTWREDHTRFLYDGQGVYLGAVILCRDIEARKQAEAERRRLLEQLQQPQKMELLGRLSGGIAHDLNNVLTAILGYTSLLGRQSSLDPFFRRALEVMDQAGRRGARMLRGLLNFARAQSGDERLLSLNRLIEEELELLSHTALARVQVHLNLDPNLPELWADPADISNCLMNLFVNAANAMPEGGSLRVRTFGRTPGLGLEITDTGIGMDEATLQRVFQPFFTTKPESRGTGLGLSMVQATVRRYEGEIALESQPGQGTRVRIEWPEGRRPAVLAPSAPGPQAPGCEEALAVALLEEDPLTASTLLALLEHLGHRVRRIEAEAAVPSTLAETDLVILDLSLPGLCSRQFYETLRTRYPHLPVLLISGTSPEGWQEVLTTDKALAFLAKPFTLSGLEEKLAAFCRESL